MAVTVLLLAGPAGNSEAEQWVAEGRRAAAEALCARLRSLAEVDDIYLVSADPGLESRLRAFEVAPFQPPASAFHFGRTVSAFLRERRLQALAYFGAASAPLASAERLRNWFERVLGADRPAALVNNLHSTDWLVTNQPQALLRVLEDLTTDNPLGWLLAKEGVVHVRSLRPTAASRLDVDTPTDLLLAEGHPDLPPSLQRFLAEAPLEARRRVAGVRRLLREEGKGLTLIGRASSAVWRALERRTRLWVRVYAEERGMVASGRLARGEVRSLVGAYLEREGPEATVAWLAKATDGVLWDTRVWLGHRGVRLSAAERFAADLGWADQIRDGPLRRLTEAILESPIPVVTGGHGVVSGGALALVETAAHQPSRN